MKIGVDLGGSHIGVGLIDNHHQIIAKLEHNWSEEEKENFFQAIEQYCKTMIKQLMKENEVSSIETIGIGYPSKAIIKGIVYEGQTEFNLLQLLKEEFLVPVYLKNDVKCAGLCEKKIGSLKPYTNCLFLTLGTGIGGAYFYQNKLVVPNLYSGLEVGHMVIERDGKECRCGRKGCFEEYASMRSFRKEIENVLQVKDITYEKLQELLEKEETREKTKKILEQFIHNLSIGIGNLIYIFEPDAISIGGSFTYFAPIMLEKLEKEIKKIFSNREIPELLVAQYTNDAGMIGASMLESNE